MQIFNNEEFKIIKSDNYNLVFRKEDGLMLRYGKTFDDIVLSSPFGPEIADIEISTICNNECKHCYKSNTKNGKNMSLNLFKKIINVLNKNDTITQVALGIGDIDSNPDLESIIDFCLSKGIMPNITINNNINDENINLIKKCKGVAVSNYYDINKTINCIKKLNKFNIKQVNIHQLMAFETLEECYELIDNFSLLKDYIYSIVFLALKKMGKGNTYDTLNTIEFNRLIKYAYERKIPIGFDSCTAPYFYDFLLKSNLYDNNFKNLVECCESTLFSIYVNVDGLAYPCSFAENKFEGINILNNLDIWNNNEINKFRNNLLNQKHEIKKKIIDYRECPFYEIISNFDNDDEDFCEICGEPLDGDSLICNECNTNLNDEEE